MRGNAEKLVSLIVGEFEEHVERVAGVISDTRDYEDAIQGAIQSRIGQIHNMRVYGVLADMYAEMLDKRLDGRAKTRRSGEGSTYADQVRSYCKRKIVDPARNRGERQIVIRAGDIHSAMGYRSRMPLVCSALGAKKFEEVAGVERIDLSGPTNGANAVFTFKIR